MPFTRGDLWRPETVGLLVTEKATSRSPSGTTLSGSRFRVTEALPDRFVRLMYCVGYGEPSVCIGGGPNGRIALRPTGAF